MTELDHLEVARLLSVFAERPTEVLDAQAQRERRERAVGRIETVLAEPLASRKASIRRVNWPLTAGAIAAGTLALAAGLALFLGRVTVLELESVATSPVRQWSSQGKFLCSRASLDGWAPCDPLKLINVTGLRTLDDATAHFETQLGVKVELSPASTVMFEETTTTPSRSRVTLALGRIDVQVPKLGPNRQFAVVTPTATVVVHGTAFTVTVAQTADATTRTCVELREGTISVESPGSTARLTAPSRWGCDSVPSTEASQSTVSTDSATNVKSRSVAPASPAENLKPRSSLAAEARLLQTALGAERRKDFSSAERSLKSLLTQYPNSVVAPEARAALERIGTKRNASQ